MTCRGPQHSGADCQRHIVFGTDGSTDVLTLNALGGDDTVDATGLAAGVIGLTVDGGAGADVLAGGPAPCWSSWEPAAQSAFVGWKGLL